ncbi:hypothetical protein FG386_001309 [Cryptosporidium ryanae]|uniref:uncharacterized protein n=1 Tax=Cryptosporidium ryanae TaxID=515981 RepID=UPI00351A0E8F|nr:hypothetical protein FG386_001309 [Cryptosporidium ryanae]
MIEKLYNGNRRYGEDLFLTPETRNQDNSGDDPQSNGPKTLVCDKGRAMEGFSGRKLPIDIDTASARRNSFVSVGSDFPAENESNFSIENSKYCYSTEKSHNDMIHRSENRIGNRESNSLYRRIMISSNFVQLLPTSAYKVPIDNSRGDNGILNNSFNIKEYGVVQGDFRVDFDPVSSEEKSEFYSNDICSSVDVFGNTKENLSNKDMNNTILVPNVPFLLCISYFRQENALNKRLNAVWIGYKTRCILRGHFGFTKMSGTNQESQVKKNTLNLRYKIHEILNSIFDLYELIKDEENKDNTNLSWLEALYDQTKEFKRRYVTEVNRLVFSKGNKWIYQIERYKEDTKYVEREINSNSIPSRYRSIYTTVDNHKKLGFNRKTNNKQAISRVKQVSDANCKIKVDSNFLNSMQEDIFTEEWDILIPVDIVKTNKKQEVSNYLNVPVEFIIKLTDEDGVEDKRIETQTPKNHFNDGKNVDYFTPKSSFNQFEREAYEYNYNLALTTEGENIYCTPKCDENRCYTQDGKLNNSISVKPRPYLKRKSKSILPSKETNIELKGVKSKVKEIYINRLAEESGKTNRNSIRYSSEATTTSKIPGASSSIKIISDSPSSRGSSAKVSRIPKYNKSNNFY